VRERAIVVPKRARKLCNDKMAAKVIGPFINRALKIRKSNDRIFKVIAKEKTKTPTDFPCSSTPWFPARRSIKPGERAAVDAFELAPFLSLREDLREHVEGL
jgi:hypothetical protein